MLARLSFCCLILWGVGGGTSLAAESATKAPVTTFSGIFDAYLSYNFNRVQPLAIPNASNPYLPPAQNQLRNFDLYDNQLSINLAELGITSVRGPLTFRLDLDFGEAADYVARQSDGTTIDEVSKHIGQAFVAYTPEGLARLTVTAGKMATHMGYETTKAKDDWQYSRSFLFSLALPYWHTGIGVTYRWVPGRFATSAYLYNGWNSIYDDNQAKTLGLQVSMNPSDAVGLVYNLISGAEQPNDNADRKTVQDLVFTWKLGEKWDWASDIAYGSTQHDLLPGGLVGDASWIAATGAIRFAPSARYYFSPRFEVYRDNGGYTSGATQTLTSLTGTQSFLIGQGMETRLEIRWDHSSIPFFYDGGSYVQDQTTVSGSLLYSF